MVKKLNFKSKVYNFLEENLLAFTLAALAGILVYALIRGTRLNIDDVIKSIFSIIGSLLGAFFAVDGALRNQKKIDSTKEKQTLSENASIIYYDIYLGLNDLRKLYICICTKDFKYAPKEIFLINTWIRDVALIRKNLLTEDGEKVNYIEEIYLIYGELITLNNMLKNMQEDNEQLIEHVKELSEKIIAQEELEELNDIFTYLESDVRLATRGEECYRTYKEDSNKQNCSSHWENLIKQYPQYKQKIKEWSEKKLKKTSDFQETYKNILKILKGLQE